MSEVVRVTPVDAAAGAVPDAEGTRARLERFAPTAMVASVLGWVLAPQVRRDRGFTTVEYIFGIILAVAVITVFISVVTNDENQHLFTSVIEWALSLRDKLGLDG